MKKQSHPCSQRRWLCPSPPAVAPLPPPLAAPPLKALPAALRQKAPHPVTTATLRMTYWNSEDTVKALLDYLGEAVPDVQIEYQFIDNSNYDTIVDTQLSAGEGPDIHLRISRFCPEARKLGYLADVSDPRREVL